MSKIARFVSFTLFFMLVLSACNLPSDTEDEIEGADAALTAAAQTVEANLTQAAILSPPTVPPTKTLGAPTSTRAAATTSVPPTNPPPTQKCDVAQFISDVTIPDGTTLEPNEAFTKTWRLKNVGTCSWTPSYKIVFISGDAMDGPATQALTGNVNSNQTVDISVDLKAPAADGDYRGNWKLRNGAGVLFARFYVDIKVAVVSSGYDLHSQAPAAEWVSGAGVLTFGGPDTDNDGFVMYRNGATLEDGSTNSKTLEMHPQWVDNGVITGLYPSYTVVAGEHFKATIGFLGPCGVGDVKFQLNYKESGTLNPLDDWTDTCDGALKNVNVDLNSIAGKNVQFALAILANGSSAQDWAVWIRPRVEIP